MAISLNSNIASLSAQRSLGRATGSVQRSFERLSSGLRIVRPSDDAASLSIAESLDAGVAISRAATRNISDGISIMSIAESTLTNLQDLVTRMRELAEQSANGVYSNNQRVSLQTEYEALLSEYDRIGASSTFNGISLLSSANQIQIQAGSDSSANSQLSIQLSDVSSSNGIVFGVADYDNDGFGAPIDALTAINYLNASPNQSVDSLQKFSGGTLKKMNITDSLGVSHNAYLVSFANVISTISHAVFEETSSGSLTKVGMATLASPTQTASVSVTFANSGTATVTADPRKLTFQTALGAAGREIGGLFGGAPTGSGIYSEKSAIAYTGVETQLRARDALNALANRQVGLSQIAGNFGALEQRLGVALGLQEHSIVSSEEAASRIRDADIAETVADLVQGQIRQKAASQVVALANLQPQLALDLLSN